MKSSAYVISVTDKKLRKCGHGGCTSVASHVLMAGGRGQCFCCAQCAAVGVKADDATAGVATRLVSHCAVLDTKEKARAYFGHSFADEFFERASMTMIEIRSTGKV